MQSVLGTLFGLALLLMIIPVGAIIGFGIVVVATMAFIMALFRGPEDW
jgi:hypothetical protein